jgi:hypothetical protein
MRHFSSPTGYLPHRKRGELRKSGYYRLCEAKKFVNREMVKNYE